MNKNIAICAGLWYAEGDKKCNNEINFCNNCFELIEIFDRTIRKLFEKHQFNVRIYVYTADSENVKIPINNCKIKRYIDNRARKPYFIWRLANVKLNSQWKKIVKEIQQNPIYYVDFLKGFFAGEGNVKTGKQSCRCLRIAQKERLSLLENMLDYLKITYSFREKERNYYISHKDNWDIFNKFNLASLHPIKNQQFLEAYNSFKEDHYRANYLKKEILNVLVNPYTSNQLANKFNRSQARIQDILIPLKKQGIIVNFRVRSKDFWVKKNQKIIIISQLKQKYLKALTSPKSTKELSVKFNVCWKASFRRLNELEKLNLVEREENKKWILKMSRNKVTAL